MARNGSVADAPATNYSFNISKRFNNLVEVVTTLALLDISLRETPVYFFASAFSIFLLYRLYQNPPYHYKTDADSASKTTE